MYISLCLEHTSLSAMFSFAPALPSDHTVPLWRDRYGALHLWTVLARVILRRPQKELHVRCEEGRATRCRVSTVGKINHSVRPDWGWTKPERYIHSYRCWTWIEGRDPLRTQTRRRSGLSPMRCSSIAHSSTVAWGCSFCSCSTSWLSFFQRLLSLGAAFTWRGRSTRLLSMETSQILPAQLGMDRVTRLLSDPDGHLGS